MTDPHFRRELDRYIEAEPPEDDPLPDYDREDFQTFVEDMRRLLEDGDLRSEHPQVQHYRGRFYYEGPAFFIDDGDDLQTVIRATTVRLQWDSLGRSGNVVYPASY